MKHNSGSTAASEAIYPALLLLEQGRQLVASMQEQQSSPL